MPGIYSPRVILVEGTADEFVSNVEAAGMHGFVIVVPPGAEGERLLDMVYRITMVYAGMPSLLRSRARVRKMVDAVMSKENRELKPAHRPARKSEVSAPTTAAKTESLPAPRGGRKANSRDRN